MRLESRYKVDGSRSVEVKDTLRRIESLAKNIGVSRVADITHLDILRIPNYSAVLPGTEDYIWVYSGKGPTKAHAKASALMECIERYSSFPSRGFDNRLIRASYEHMIKEYGKDAVLSVDELVEPLKLPYRDDMVIDFIDGIDLFNNERVFLPAGIVLSRYEPNNNTINPFKLSHTNGLASGNVIEEAIEHALCEVIERDAVSLAELRSSVLQFHKLKIIVDRLNSLGYKIRFDDNEFVDDTSIFDEVDVSNISIPFAKYLINRFKEENIPLLIKDVTSDIGIPTFIATSVQWITDDYGYLAEGHGTHPNAGIALIRAITEVSQTRAANIHGARDDLRKIDYRRGSVENKAWQFMHSNTKSFESIKSYDHKDILEDIEFTLSSLRRAGLNKAIIVDLTDKELKIPVVRAVVPGLETFKVSRSIIGWRGMRYL
ncbi:MAG: YcaO-like family protein [Candidatus Nitrosocaldaceae archaeon]